MPTNYPTSLDTITEPASTATLGGGTPTHHSHHVNVGDAIEAIEAELGTDPSADFATVKDRLLAVARGIHNRPGVYIAGRYYLPFSNYSWNGVSGAANRMDLQPFYVTDTTTFDRLAINVNTAVASSAVKVGIYDSDGPNGRPSSRLVDGGELLTATTGVKEATISQQLIGGKVYWFACLHSSTATLRSLGASNPQPVGATTAAAASGHGYSYTQTYATGLPATLTDASVVDTALAGHPICWLRAA